MNFILCIDTLPFGDLSTTDLTLGRLYEVIEGTDEHGMIRIIDDSGEDYLYPIQLFESIQLPNNIAKRLHSALLAA